MPRCACINVASHPSAQAATDERCTAGRAQSRYRPDLTVDLLCRLGHSEDCACASQGRRDGKVPSEPSQRSPQRARWRPETMRGFWPGMAERAVMAITPERLTQAVTGEFSNPIGTYTADSCPA